MWNFFDGSGIIFFVALTLVRVLNIDKETLIVYNQDYEDEFGHLVELTTSEIDAIDYSVRLKFMCFFLLF